MNLQEALEGVDGWLYIEEAQALHDLAAGLQLPQVWVEIGSFKGRSTIAMALDAGVPGFAVDPHEYATYDAYPFGDPDRHVFMANLVRTGLAQKVRIWDMRSKDAARAWPHHHIGLLFIDGYHPEVALDLEWWLPFVDDGAFIALHDINTPPVIAAVAGRSDLIPVSQVGITGIFRKGTRYVSHETPYGTLLIRSGVYHEADMGAAGDVMTYLMPDFRVTTCLDLGAHIGCFTRWLKTQYPDAMVSAVEASSANAALAALNLQELSLVSVVHAAVGSLDGPLSLVLDPINSGGHYVTTSVPDGLPSEAVPQVMSLEDLMGIAPTWDLVKMDIEGSETEVILNASDETLHRIRAITGERHTTAEVFEATIGHRLREVGFTVTDIPHPAMSVPPWNMDNRGLFLAVRNDEPPIPNVASEPPLEYGTVIEEVKPKPKPVRRKPGRKPGRKTSQ